LSIRKLSPIESMPAYAMNARVEQTGYVTSRLAYPAGTAAHLQVAAARQRLAPYIRRPNDHAPCGQVHACSKDIGTATEESVVVSAEY
jgi:hypothetical protein